jgi:hypothetical protein
MTRSLYLGNQALCGRAFNCRQRPCVTVDKRRLMLASLVNPSLRVLTWCCAILLAALSLLPAQQMVRTGLPGRLEHFGRGLTSVRARDACIAERKATKLAIEAPEAAALAAAQAAEAADSGNADRRLILKLEYVLQRTVEPIGPRMRAGKSVD